jgi:hypothetical protein
MFGGGPLAVLLEMSWPSCRSEVADVRRVRIAWLESWSVVCFHSVILLFFHLERIGSPDVMTISTFHTHLELPYLLHHGHTDCSEISINWCVRS